VTYDLAVQLLGYTPDSLLDEAIDAFAASDGSTVFGVVDKVIESGQDPRRFAEDLLQRLRDLVIVAAVPDADVRELTLPWPIEPFGRVVYETPDATVIDLGPPDG
jgi:DNA polymerase III gamma/tau subunit